ncbi:TonB-dependent siderophore receptor [Skermanella sp. TT6]|uniref:TonB-dependent siderophore receptor n=1 Tax=Skermanella cutis TaxID=2775420 RepID=A0ABX7BCK8_9PROT|nr:TonB-dependent siderophore receptor [Skermanella sp. TT6]QQP90781.1 TonB-dependent siderophore receptor [Skermanella sp. TT6]
MPSETRPISLLARLLGTAAVMILPAGASAQGTEGGQIVLPPISVETTAPTGTSPVQGYVAPVTSTATKTDTPLIETPQSISVITRDQLDDRAVQSITEALGYTAGTFSSTFADPRFDDPVIRGFSAGPNQFLDGLRILRTFGAPAIEPYGLERVEVLRGPSSVLYGQSVPGGLVNMVSKRPTEQSFGEVNLQAGSHDRYQGSFDLGGPLDQEGQFLYRLTALGRKSDTQMDHVEDDRWFVAPALTWKPGPDTRLTLLGRFQHDEAQSPPGLPAVGTLFGSPFGDISTSFYPGEPTFRDSELELSSIGYDFEHRIDDTFTIRQNARYLHLRFDYDTLFTSGLAADQRTLRRGSLVQRESSDTVNVDTSGQAKFATGPLGHTALLGVDYRRFWGDTRTGFGAAPSLDLLNPVYGQAIAPPPIGTDRDDDLSQLGIYVQDQVRLDKWLLTLGGRHDWVETEQRSRITGAETTQDDSAFTGRAALMYLFDGGFAPYVSYTTSFDPVIGTQAPQRGGGSFEPTEGEQYEVGLKYQPPGSNSFFTAALFDLTRTNVTTTDPDFPTFQVQTGEARVRGIELEATASLMRGLDVTAAYTYLDSEVTESNTGTEGNRLAAVPEHLASLWGDYSFPEGSLLEGFGLGAGVRHIGSRFGNEANDIKVPDVTLFDAAIRYDFDRFRVALNANNLFDKEYVTSCGSVGGCYYGNRLAVISTLTYRW